MPFTGLATKNYKDPGTVQWANSIKGNFDMLGPHGAWVWGKFDGSGLGTAFGTYNVANISRTAAGRYKIEFVTGFNNDAFACKGSAIRTVVGLSPNSFAARDYAVTSVTLSTNVPSTDAAGDSEILSFDCHGTGTGV